jgi:hypothetical protein
MIGSRADASGGAVSSAQSCIVKHALQHAAGALLHAVRAALPETRFLLDAARRIGSRKGVDLSTDGLQHGAVQSQSKRGFISGLISFLHRRWQMRNTFTVASTAAVLALSAFLSATVIVAKSLPNTTGAIDTYSTVQGEDLRQDHVYASDTEQDWSWTRWPSVMDF